MSFQDMLQQMTPGQGFPGQPGTGGPPAEGGDGGEIPPQLLEWLSLILSMMGQGEGAGPGAPTPGQMPGAGGPPMGPPTPRQSQMNSDPGLDPQTAMILEAMLAQQPGGPPTGFPGQPGDPNLEAQARGQARRGGGRPY